MVVFESIDVAIPIPAGHAPEDPMLKHQGWAVTFDLVMDADALIDRVGHGEFTLGAVQT
jgi:hypothetical protein